MLDLSEVRRVVVVGGGTAGWFAALEMRHSFPAHVDVMVIESDQIGIIGAGEGSIPNFELALQRYDIDRTEFMAATQATYKLGVAFEGWRNGQPDDRYFHFFSARQGPTSLTDWQQNGFHPLSAKLIAEGIGLDAYPDAKHLVDVNASQSDVAAFLNSNPREVFAWHFDARKLAAYLAKVAMGRGVQRVNAMVKDCELDEHGCIARLVTDTLQQPGDFFVDASGFRKVLAGKALGIEWKSFSNYLILDAALPFFLPLDELNPPLVTRSTALDAGWMWTIPTQGRLGCGYVYSTHHVTEQQALNELENRLGRAVEPVNRLRFSPGRLDQCLKRNVLAVGLASGFVEPLEATSIAQTLDQLAFFGDLVADNRFLLPEQVVSRFNTEIRNGWYGILDFLVMHYDTKRSDTNFWVDVGHLPRTNRYLELKAIFQCRTPTHTDLVPYGVRGQPMFGVPSWEMVASAMGLVSQVACQRMLSELDSQAQARLDAFAALVRPKQPLRACEA